MLILSVFLSCLMIVKAGPATEASYKGQFCTDPRTMRQHAAYTEWADAYSCTRHRCQPGGRNLAIYTVGCKRVEAPESAIECEEVVEDTNMQFPYCCTRLRCLVVVRGEVWTRVLGQPWETLPAAPWSHMYKMKKPPPGEAGFLPKLEAGPVYELQSEDTGGGNMTPPEEEKKVLRTAKKTTEAPDEVVNRAGPPAPPDIVIALQTSSDKENDVKKEEGTRHKRGRKQESPPSNGYFEDELLEPRNEEPEEPVTIKEGRKQESAPGNVYFEGDILEPRADDIEEPVTVRDKEPQPDPLSEEHYYANSYATQKPVKGQHHQVAAWTEIPQSQWNEHEHETAVDPDAPPRNSWIEPEALHMASESPVARADPVQNWPEFPAEEKKEEKPGNLQALVDAIGTRMRDIESVVAKMSEKVHKVKPIVPEPYPASAEKSQVSPMPYKIGEGDRKHHEQKEKDRKKMKKPSPDGEHYKRFSPHTHSANKYLRSSDDVTTEQPLFVDDTNLNGYYSDASNSLVKRAQPKEPQATYMAPVENRRRGHAEDSEELKRKKKSHKKKRTKGHHKKHHSKDGRRKFRLNSVEVERNAVSLEDSSIGGGSKQVK